jgi:hypothetical protein
LRIAYPISPRGNSIIESTGSLVCTVLAWQHPLPGFFQLFPIEKALISAAGEGIHDLDHPFLPFLLADEGRVFYLSILLDAKFKISFGAF